MRYPNLLQRIRNRLRLFLYGRVHNMLSLGLKLRSPRLVAAALAIFTERLGDTPKENVRYRVLCINIPVFIDDVKALNDQTPQIEFFLIDYVIFQYIYRVLMPDPGITINNYVEHRRRHPEQHEAIERFWRAVLVHWRKRYQFDAVLYGLWGYPKFVAFSSACVAHDIPFVVLERHGTQSPNKIRHKLEEYYLKTHFYCTKLLTANGRFAEAFIQVPGARKDKVVPVGIPRTDVLFQTRGGSGSSISLFITLPILILNYINNASLERASERLERFYVSFIKVSQQFPDLPFVIKSKQSAQHRNYAADLLQRYSLTPGENLRITSEIEPAKLIQASRLVLAFQSAVLFEALANGKPIAEPDLRDLLSPGDSYSDEYAQVVNYVTSQEDLVRLIQNPQGYVGAPAVRERLLRKYLYCIDGKASKRVNNILIAEIEKARERKLSNQIVLGSRVTGSP